MLLCFYSYYCKQLDSLPPAVTTTQRLRRKLVPLRASVVLSSVERRPWDECALIGPLRCVRRPRTMTVHPRERPAGFSFRRRRDTVAGGESWLSARYWMRDTVADSTEPAAKLLHSGSK